MSSIFLRQGDSFVAMAETPYDAEEVLQELIEQHPQLLVGADGPHGPLVLVRREAGVSETEDGAGRWSLDHLYLDRAGVPTLVEVKRSTDTRARREVVAQMLDHASNAQVSFSADRMMDWLEETARERGSTGEEVLRDAFGIDDVDAYWAEVDKNIKAESFRLVFVADKIGRELRRIVEYLNRQMHSTEVLAIEVKQFVDADGEHQTIVPVVVGDTSEARAAKRPRRQRETLDRDTLLAKLAEYSEAARDAGAAIFDWAEGDDRLSTHFTGTGVAIKAESGALLKIWVYPPWIDRALEIHLPTLLEHPEGETLAESVRSDLDSMGIELLGNPKWPQTPIEKLADTDLRRRFLSLMESVLEKLSADAGS